MGNPLTIYHSVLKNPTIGSTDLIPTLWMKKQSKVTQPASGRAGIENQICQTPEMSLLIATTCLPSHATVVLYTQLTGETLGRRPSPELGGRKFQSSDRSFPSMQRWKSLKLSPSSGLESPPLNYNSTCHSIIRTHASATSIAFYPLLVLFCSTFLIGAL